MTRLLPVCLAFSLMTASCLPSGPAGGRPERRKMLTPDALEGSWESSGLTASPRRTASGAAAGMTALALPFTLADTTILQGGEELDYMLLRLPSADYDYLLLAAKNFESWLPSWLAAWPQSGRHGVAIQLTGGTATNRTDFLVTVAGLSDPLPLILFWDANSADRAVFFTQFLQSLTAIHCEKIK